MAGKRSTVFVVAALLTLPAMALAATGGGRVLVGNCNAAQYKPKQLELACGDGSNYLTRLNWKTWTATKATATGTHEINGCTPDCVSGQFHGYPATVTLSKPMTCKKTRHKLFGHIQLVYGSKHPGSKRTASGPLFCPQSLPSSY
ncbi:MAG TPA: hypothetical protein VMP89_11990 [Solirubrobacteraceae bacterium]|nr:hypothetical protein [Solirubrobacteraceae bacterium]